MTPISRRNFIKGGIATAAAGLGVAGFKYAPGILSGRSKDSRPNVIFVTIDTTRYDRMGFNGYERDTTPNLDKYAEQGIVFHKNYAQAPITPFSVASFLTSQYPLDLPFDNMWSSIPGKALTMAEILRGRGYSTLGATSTELLDNDHGFSRGFDFFSSPGKEGVLGGPIRLGEDTVNKLIGALENKPIEYKPHFIWYHSYDPHTPYFPHEGFTDNFKTKGNFDDKEMNVWGALTGDPNRFISAYNIDYTGDVGMNLLTEQEVVDANDQYDGQILYADHHIERLISYLSEKGLFDINRDLLVVNSDHGELMGGHKYCSSHFGSYQDVKHTPLLFSGAGLPIKKSIHDLTENVDILPTILDIIDFNSNNEPDHSEIRYRNLNWRGKNLLTEDGSKTRETVYTDLVDGTGHSLNTDELSITLRRMPSDFPHKNLQEIVDYSPQGVLNFSDVDKEKCLTLSWPGNEFQDKQSLFTKVSVSEVRDGQELSLFNLEVPYKGNRFKFVHRLVFGEDGWNEASPYLLRWDVQVLSKKDGKEEVLFDSKNDGTLEFRLTPTENFSKLFDLGKDPREEVNLWHNPNYSTKITELDKELDLLLPNSKDKRGFTEASPEERETLRALGYL